MSAELWESVFGGVGLAVPSWPLGRVRAESSGTPEEWEPRAPPLVKPGPGDPRRSRMWETGVRLSRHPGVTDARPGSGPWGPPRS